MKKLILFALLIVSFMSHAQRPAITGGSYNIVIDTNSLSNRINNTDTKINNHLLSDNDTIIGNEVDSIWKVGLTYYIQKGASTFTLTDSAGGVDTDSQSIYLSNDTLYITRGNFAIIPKIDTISLSNRINTKLTASDTASLSDRIDAKQDTQSLSITGTTLTITRGNSVTLPIADTSSLSDRINNLNTQISNHVANDLDTIIGNEIDSAWKVGDTFFFKKGATTFALKDSIGASSAFVGDTTNDEWKSVGTNTMLNRLTTGALRTSTNNVFIRDNGTVRIGGDLDLGGVTSPKLQIIHSGTTSNLPYAIITGSSTVTDPTGIFLRSIDSSYLTSGYNGSDPTTSNLIFDFASTPRTEVMRIRADGRVGINSPLPTTTLDIGGTLRIRTLNTNTSDTVLVSTSNGTIYKKYIPIQYNTANQLVILNSTGAAVLPRGTTAQRPATSTAGMERFNTTYNGIEFFNGTNWILIRAVLSADPTGLGAGSTYYSTTTNTMRYFNGTIWQNY